MALVKRKNVAGVKALAVSGGNTDLNMIASGLRRIDDPIVRYYLMMLVDRIADLLESERPTRKGRPARKLAVRPAIGIRR